MNYKFVILTIVFVLLSGMAFADDPVDLVPGTSTDLTGSSTDLIADASSKVPDPWGEMDPSLGAAAALNKALGLYFSGYASKSQLQAERDMADSADAEAVRWAPFAKEVLGRLNRTMGTEFPEAVDLQPFDLSPSEPPVMSPDNSHIVIVTYDREKYLERLLQRLYFKLIQGPILLTVPYRADAPSVPPEYRNWNNFRYGHEASDTVTWNSTRLVYVDWALTQTVVLKYEDGKIACYDSGKKYYIDHTAAVVAAGAMMAHPRFKFIAPDGAVDFLLTSSKRK
jgi:hypothetical protein